MGDITKAEELMVIDNGLVPETVQKDKFWAKVDGNKVVVYNEANPQGMVLPEAYLTEATTGSVTITLGKDQFFVMGDNRDASFDSRRFGAIDRDDVIGRVWVRGWPFSRVTTFSQPSYNL